jgi:predicted DNA-binding transcriptional regulator AlpA
MVLEKQPMSYTRLLKEAEVSERLGISTMTLRKWRLFRKGPGYLKLGPKAVRYPEADLCKWIESLQRGGDVMEAR